MSTERNKEIAEAVKEAINQRKLQDLDQFFAPDAVDHVVPHGLEPTREGLRQLLSMVVTTFPDAYWFTDFTLAEGDRVVQRLSGSGTMERDLMGLPATHRKSLWTETHIFRLADGKIVEHWGNIDQAGMTGKTDLPSPSM